MTVPFVFGNAQLPLPLNELDTNFAYLLALTGGLVPVPGLVGDGVTDNTTAIAAAYAALPAAGGVLFFPQGVFAFNSALTFSSAKPVALMGAGPFATVLQPSFAAGDAITVTSAVQASLINLSVTSNVARNQGAYLARVRSAVRCMVSNVFFNTPSGGLFYPDTINFLQMVNVQGDSNNGIVGDTCLRLNACGGTISNTYLRQGPGTTTVYGNNPTVWITGQTTSLKIDNCGFSGGGPRSKFVVSGIVSGPSNFTVTTVGNHDFAVGDIVVLRGNTPTAYNDDWRAAAVGANTIVINSTLNPGVSTIQGTAESVTACFYVSNESGAVNESSVTNTVFEALTTRRFGTASVLFDGRRGTPGARGIISGWTLGSGNYYDFGATSILLAGTNADATNAPTISGVDIVGGEYQSVARMLHLEQGVAGITFNGCQTGDIATAADSLVPAGTGSMAVYIYAGASAPFPRGITLSDNKLGMPRTWLDADLTSNSFSNALVLDGAGIQDLVVADNYLYGVGGLTVRDINSALSTSSRWSFKGNQIINGTPPITNAMVIPTIASANTLGITIYNEVIKISGTTNIQFINGAPARVWQSLTLIFTGALNLITGGNIAITANYAVLAGQAVVLTYDGTAWYVK